jgi:hypothetical protein
MNFFSSAWVNCPKTAIKKSPNAIRHGYQP